eukprot:scaffold306091_cov35-Tisochrysis_lutea.AAC.2
MGEPSSSADVPITLQDLSRRELQALAKSHGVRANMKSETIIAEIEALWAESRTQPPVLEEESEPPSPTSCSITQGITTPDQPRRSGCVTPGSTSAAFFSAMHERVASIIAKSPAMSHPEIRRSFDVLSSTLKQASERHVPASSHTQAA